MALVASFCFAKALRLSKPSISFHRNGPTGSFTLFVPFSSAASSSSAFSHDNLKRKKWRQHVASVLELGGVKIAKDGNFSLFFSYGLLRFPFFFSLPEYTCKWVLLDILIDAHLIQFTLPWFIPNFELL